jgi:hypothetical protein
MVTAAMSDEFAGLPRIRCDLLLDCENKIGILISSKLQISSPTFHLIIGTDSIVVLPNWLLNR